MRNIFSGKTLIPLSIVISLAPGAAYIIDTRTKCELAASEVTELQRERAYIRQKIDQLSEGIAKIQISIGVVEHELRTKNGFKK